MKIFYILHLIVLHLKYKNIILAYFLFLLQRTLSKNYFFLVKLTWKKYM